MRTQDRSSTLAAMVAAKEAEAVAVRKLLTQSPLSCSQSTGAGTVLLQGSARPLSAAASLPQPGQELRQLAPHPSILQVCRR